jgi:hypothetical protein
MASHPDVDDDLFQLGIAIDFVLYSFAKAGTIFFDNVPYTTHRPTSLNSGCTPADLLI